MSKKSRVALCIACALQVTATSVMADPFAITRTTSIFFSQIAAFQAGQVATLTMVFDNGGTSAVNQTWVGADARCAIATFNNGGIVVTFNLVAHPMVSAQGAVTTGVGGVLTSTFTSGSTGDTFVPDYTVTGTTVVDPIKVNLNASDLEFTFVDTSNGTQSVFDFGPATISNPVPFAGNCAGLILAPAPVPPAPVPGPVGVQPVPTLSQWALVGLSLQAGVAGVCRLRRRRS